MLAFRTGNGRRIFLSQDAFDKPLTISTYNDKAKEGEFEIPAPDFIMMLNYYQYIKAYNIAHDWLNPNGEEVE